MKTIKIRIFLPGNKKSKMQIIRCKPGHVYHEKGVDVILAKIADNITKMYPDEDYGLVPVGDCQFNFVHRGKLEVA